jgi:hypothetical protein
MGFSLEEMEMGSNAARSARSAEEFVTHVAVVQDEETGIVSRQPIRFCLGHGGSLTIRHYPPKREDPDFHLGAVGSE